MLIISLSVIYLGHFPTSVFFCAKSIFSIFITYHVKHFSEINTDKGKKLLRAVKIACEKLTLYIYICTYSVKIIMCSFVNAGKLGVYIGCGLSNAYEAIMKDIFHVRRDAICTFRHVSQNFVQG